VGPVGVLSAIEIHGDQLLLKDLLVYPTETDKRLPVGVEEMLQIVRSIESEARGQGFRTCIVEAKRLSGAKPGRMMKLTRRLR